MSEPEDDEGTVIDFIVNLEEQARILSNLRRDTYTVKGGGFLPGERRNVPLVWIDRGSDLRRLIAAHDRVSQTQEDGLDVQVRWRGGLGQSPTQPGALRLDVVWGPPFSQ